MHFEISVVEMYLEFKIYLELIVSAQGFFRDSRYELKSRLSRSSRGRSSSMKLGSTAAKDETLARGGLNFFRSIFGMSSQGT